MAYAGYAEQRGDTMSAMSTKAIDRMNKEAALHGFTRKVAFCIRNGFILAVGGFISIALWDAHPVLGIFSTLMTFRFLHSNKEC